MSATARVLNGNCAAQSDLQLQWLCPSPPSSRRGFDTNSV